MPIKELLGHGRDKIIKAKVQNETQLARDVKDSKELLINISAEGER